MKQKETYGVVIEDFHLALDCKENVTRTPFIIA